MSKIHAQPISGNRLMRYTTLSLAVGLVCASWSVAAQEAPVELERIEVIGSRIKKVDVEGLSPILTINRQQIEQSGQISVGDILQRLTSSGQALNTQYNTSGNAGPADGGGIGAGSTQVDLRHLEAKRVLVLVDGKRWVNESSASGVGGAVDLNTIPLSIVEAIEVLSDGASAIYGSDAIAGVVNIVTRRDFDGAEIIASHGEFSQGDGQTLRAEMTIGGGGERFRSVFSASFNEQREVSSGARDISNHDPAGITRGSPVTPQGRAVFVAHPLFPALPPGFPLTECGPSPIPGVPLCDVITQAGGALAGNGAPDPASFVRYTDDQSFNIQPFNLVLTPNRRKSLYSSFQFDLTDDISWYAKALYNQRESQNRAAANPLVIGPEAPGNGLADTISIAANNPYNPFGIPLLAGQNMFAAGRRPLEAGPRIFEQSVDTYYFNTGLEGRFEAGPRVFFWDVNVINSENRAKQIFRNTYNMRRVQLALGNPATCQAVPGCVPLNLFGTFTPEMLAWIRTDVSDTSEQELTSFSANLSGDLFSLPGGDAAFATGLEHRRYDGSYTPDAQRIAGEIPDPASTVPTIGDYDVSEAYLEVILPLAPRFDLSLAARYSDYSTFGDVTTGKLAFKWQPIPDLLLRGTFAQGFRAPSIGELYGLSQFGASIEDPCSQYPGSSNEANCAALGIPGSYRQQASQVFITTGGNDRLKPETSDSFTAGVVYSPSWADERTWSDKLDFELTYYNHRIEDAIQAPNAQDVLNACVASGDANSQFCSPIVRGSSGSITAFDNRLANIGSIETDGVDILVTWALETSIGRFDTNWQTTFVNDYEATDTFGNTFSRTVGVETRDSAIPEFQSNLRVGWSQGDYGVSWRLRYIDKLMESCSDVFDNNPSLSLTARGLCSEPNFANPQLSRDKLGSTTYHDLYASWNNVLGVGGFQLAVGLNNVFDKDPRSCFSCSLNGYDPSTYDVPGRFWYLQAAYRFN